MKITRNTVIQGSDPVFGLSGLVDRTLARELRRVITSLPEGSFKVASTGKKLSLEHHEERAISLVKSDAVIELMRRMSSSHWYDTMYNCLKETKSRFNISDQDGGYNIKPLRLRSRDRGLQGVSSEWWVSEKSFTREEKTTIREAYFAAFRSVPFIPNMQFSIMKPGSFIPAHTDISNKIATLMIYLPDCIQEGKKLGTTFYRSNGPAHTIMQNESKFLDRSDTTELLANSVPQVTSFITSRTLLFFRTDTSWHSFNYDKNIDYGDRVSINVNLLLPV